MEIDKQSKKQNLKRGNPAWKKGVSGNPNGRPKKEVCITTRQKEMMLEICPFDSQGRTWIEALSEGGLRQSLVTPAAMSNLQDRHEGKVTQPIGGEDGQPIKHEVIVSSELSKRLTEQILQGENT